MYDPIKKNVVVYPNNKPSVTKELESVINKKKRPFYIADLLEKRSVSREVRKSELAKAKLNYKNKIEMNFGRSNIKAAWQGTKTMACINKHADWSNPKLLFSSQNTGVTNKNDAFDGLHT